MKRTFHVLLMTCLILLVADCTSLTSSPSFSSDCVIVISVDGLRPDAILSEESETPTLDRLAREGAFTLEANTDPEWSVTLPNHTGILTGRFVKNHGVSLNDDPEPGTTVHSLKGEYVDSVFNWVKLAGGTTGLYASKTKFSLFLSSWPAQIDESAVSTRTMSVVDKLLSQMETTQFNYIFLHFRGPDSTGHEYEWMSRRYLNSVERVDQMIGRVVEVVESNDGYKNRTHLIVTADHGGEGTDHGDITNPLHYTIPFIVWGPAIQKGPLSTNADSGRPGDAGPVRNGHAAPTALRLLGIQPPKDWDYSTLLFTWKRANLGPRVGLSYGLISPMAKESPGPAEYIVR